jgi:hypothetical protein
VHLFARGEKEEGRPAVQQLIIMMAMLLWPQQSRKGGSPGEREGEEYRGQYKIKEL